MSEGREKRRAWQNGFVVEYYTLLRLILSFNLCNITFLNNFAEFFRNFQNTGVHLYVQKYIRNLKVSSTLHKIKLKKKSVKTLREIIFYVFCTITTATMKVVKKTEYHKIVPRFKLLLLKMK